MQGTNHMLPMTHREETNRILPDFSGRCTAAAYRKPLLGWPRSS
jgi:hypothetical protein